MPELAPSPRFKFWDNNGDPAIGWKVYTYEAGTLTPKPTYTDYTGSTANTNPVILNARGEEDIWWDGVYKVVIKDDDDNTIYTVDNYEITDLHNAPNATTHNMTSDADYTLTAAQESYGRIIITDTSVNLTTGRNIICSTKEQGYYFQNDTVQTLTLKTSAGTGIAVLAGEKHLLLCDGTNVVRSIYEIDQIVPIVTGGTGESTAQAGINALTAVSGASTNELLQKDGSGDATWAKVKQDNIDTTVLTPIVQYVYDLSGVTQTGSTLMPNGDAIPQNDEGDQYLSLAITPKSTTNLLVIEAQLDAIQSSYNTRPVLVMALFQDSDADALSSTRNRGSLANDPMPLHIKHTMVAGTISETTFKIRAGCPNTGTTTISASDFGETANSYITITEISQ